MTASKEELGALHRLVTKAYIGEIETCLDEQVPVTPALLSGAAKFLKDNEITADPAEAKDLRDLQSRLKEASGNRERRRNNIIDFAKQQEG